MQTDMRVLHWLDTPRTQEGEAIEFSRRQIMALPLAWPAWPQTAGPKLKIDIYSRHLLWLRRAEEVAAAALEMGFDGVDVTVRPGNGGHVAPDRVAEELPAFVKALRSPKPSGRIDSGAYHGRDFAICRKHP